MTAAPVARRLAAYMRRQGGFAAGCFDTTHHLAGSTSRANVCKAIDFCSCCVLLAGMRKPLWYDPKTGHLSSSRTEPSSQPMHSGGRRPQRWKLEQVQATLTAIDD